MLGLGYLIVDDAEQQLRNERLRLVTSGAKTLASGSLDALVTRDYELLERWVSSVLLTEDYAYAFLANPAGQILTHTDLEFIARYTKPVRLNNYAPMTREIPYRGLTVTEVIYPAMLGDQHLANAHVAFYPGRSNISAIRTFKFYALILGSLLLMLGATLIIVRRHTAPISQLTQYVSQLSLEHDHPALNSALLEHQDEVGMLSRAFNEMEIRLITAFEQLRNEEGRLRERVDERTQELLLANKELETFSYTVSHDLRSPLRTIDGFSLVLLVDYAEQLDEEGKQHLHRIRRGTQRMAQLIDDILELSRVSRTNLIMTTCDIATIAQEVREELEFNQPDHQFQWQIADNLFVRADRHLLHIILTNLIGNAWKYTGKTPQPCIEIGSITQADAITVFYVRDNGSGFNMKYADKLFKPFSRLHGREEFEGTGIGLATAYRIIERHKGKIWAEAKPGEGACFYFQLGKINPKNLI